MTHVAHRRFLTVAEANARRPLSAAQRLGPVGWTFAVLAVAWAVIELWPLTQFSAFDSLDQDALLIVRTLGDVALLALPAGLLLGFPGARRRSPWLFRGLVLLALVQLAQPAMRALQGWAFGQETPSLYEGTFSPLFAAMSLLSLALAVVSLAGVWAISDGLFDAGARPRRAALVVITAAAVGLELMYLVPVVVVNGLAVFPNGGLDMMSVTVSVALYVAWFIVGARLVAGFAARLMPRRAWALGALAGALFIVESLIMGLQLAAGQLWGFPVAVGPLQPMAASTVWVLLFLALTLGLGRGTNRGAGERRRIPRYERRRPAQSVAAGTRT